MLPLIAACLPALAGCPAPGAVSDVDRQRLAVLQSEKIVASATGNRMPTLDSLSRRRSRPIGARSTGASSAPWGRPFRRRPAQRSPLRPRPKPVRSQRSRARHCAVPAGRVLRGLYAAKRHGSARHRTPVAQLGTGSMAVRRVRVQDDRPVSYFAGVQGMATDTAQAYVALLAPNEHETVTNLFPDRPPAVSPARTATSRRSSRRR